MLYTARRCNMAEKYTFSKASTRAHLKIKYDVNSSRKTKAEIKNFAWKLEKCSDYNKWEVIHRKGFIYKHSHLLR